MVVSYNVHHGFREVVMISTGRELVEVECGRSRVAEVEAVVAFIVAAEVDPEVSTFLNPIFVLSCCVDACPSKCLW